jgi:lysophospholipase L1-like esterase
MCKLLKHIPHVETQAVPGANLDRILSQLKSVDLTSRWYMGVIIHGGTNEISDGTPAEIIVQKMTAILNFLEETTPDTKIAVGLILPRPQDFDRDATEGAIKEENRERTNVLLKQLCRDRHVLFANSINCVLTNKQFDINMYSDDHLHLSQDGLDRLKEYYQGVGASLIDRN